MSILSLIHNKIFTKNDFLNEAHSWKLDNQIIVFTNGVFDILHRGHIEYLATAANCGDKFVVAINSDLSVKSLNKGNSRPLQDENSRALIIAALAFVDAVLIFDDSTPLNLISEVNPNVLVKGGDYDASIVDASNKKYIVGSGIVKKNGGKVRVIPFVNGYSTTKIEEKIKHS